MRRPYVVCTVCPGEWLYAHRVQTYPRCQVCGEKWPDPLQKGNKRGHREGKGDQPGSPAQLANAPWRNRDRETGAGQETKPQESQQTLVDAALGGGMGVLVPECFPSLRRFALAGSGPFDVARAVGDIMLESSRWDLSGQQIMELLDKQLAEREASVEEPPLRYKEAHRTFTAARIALEAAERARDKAKQLVADLKKKAETAATALEDANANVVKASASFESAKSNLQSAFGPVSVALRALVPAEPAVADGTRLPLDEDAAAPM